VAAEPRLPLPSSPPPPGKRGSSKAPAPPEKPASPKLPDRPSEDPEPSSPPPLPDLPRAPDVHPPRGSAEWPGPPEPHRSGGRSASGVLAGVVIASLVANIVLAARVADTNKRLDQERARVTALNNEVARMRERLAQSQQNGSPIDRVIEAVTKIRMLEFERKVDAEILSDAALRKRILEELQKSDERAQIVATDKVLTALGLLKPEADLYDIYVGVQTEQIGGFYDSKTHKLVVAGTANGSNPLDRFLLSHELTHAVTDQHFNLSRLDKLQDERKDDESAAFLALVEGDATAVMDIYRADYLTEAEGKEVERALGASPSTKFRAAPSIVQQSLLFPYEAGLLFVNALIQRGGYAAVDKAYQDPPTSTEQILHPGKYLSDKRDLPQDVTLPDIAGVMGSGWKEIDAGGMGELDIRLIVDEFLPRADANAASEGWDGGHYVALESGAGTLIAAATVWDSDSEAREAGDILERWLQDRFAGRGSSYRVDGGRGWDAPTGAGAVVRSGDKVFLIVGPDKASVEKARAAAGASGTSA
jgi:hypothetical protein